MPAGIPRDDDGFFCSILQHFSGSSSELSPQVCQLTSLRCGRTHRSPQLASTTTTAGGVLGAALPFVRPCDHAATSSSSSSTMTCSSSSSSAEWWTFLLCGSFVYPQCKLCSRPSKCSRCRSWTGCWRARFLCNARCAVHGRQGHRHLCRGADAVSLGSGCSENHLQLQFIDKVFDVSVVQVQQVLGCSR